MVVKTKSEDEPVEITESETVEDDLRAISESFGTPDIYAKIYSISLKGREYLSTLPFNSLIDNPEECLKDVFGGGSFELWIYVYDNDASRHRLRKRIKVNIKGIPKEIKEIKENSSHIVENSLDVNPIIDRLAEVNNLQIDATRKLAEERVENARESSRTTVDLMLASMKSTIEQANNSHQNQIQLMQQMFQNQLETTNKTFELALKSAQSNSGQRSPLIELAAIAAPIIETLITVNKGTGGLLSKVTEIIGPQAAQILKENGNVILGSLIEEIGKQLLGNNPLSGILGKLAGGMAENSVKLPEMVVNPVVKPVIVRAKTESINNESK